MIAYDWQYADKLDEYCRGKLLLPQNKLLAKVKGLKAFLTGEAISIPYYYNSQKMRQWATGQIHQHKITKVFVYSSVMAQYVNDDDSLRRVVDFVDVDSDKWRQYAEGKSGLGKFIYNREYLTLQQFENTTASLAHHSLFVSPQEADLFKKQVPAELADRISGMLNGVDTKFFDPVAELDALDNESVDVVFTGAMDYWANVDAVLWFTRYAWPKVRERHPEAKFYIVGGNPSQDVQALDGKHGVVVTGRVKDVRPYIRSAKVAVAPLQIARGIQNKVLEALSMAKPVIATNMAIEGIDARGEHVGISDDPAEYAELVSSYLSQPVNAPENRQWIMENLQWNATLARLPVLFETS